MKNILNSTWMCLIQIFVTSYGLNDEYIDDNCRYRQVKKRIYFRWNTPFKKDKVTKSNIMCIL